MILKDLRNITQFCVFFICITPNYTRPYNLQVQSGVWERKWQITATNHTFLQRPGGKYCITVLCVYRVMFLFSQPSCHIWQFHSAKEHHVLHYGTLNDTECSF